MKIVTSIAMRFPAHRLDRMVRAARATWRAVIHLCGALAVGLVHGSASGQEAVEPGTGRLVASVTDARVPAGPVVIDWRRTYRGPPWSGSLFGAGWQSNWEVRVVVSNDGAAIDDGDAPLMFAGDGPGTYRSATGERLVRQASGFVRMLADGSSESFDAAGRLVSRELRNGNKATVRYDANGRIAAIEGAGGAGLRPILDGDGRVTRVEGGPQTVHYRYASGRLVEARTDDAPAVRYAYDPRGALQRIERPDSGPVELGYDDRLRVTARRWADGTTERYEYDDRARRQRRVDPRGRATTVTVAADGRRIDVVDPDGARSSMALDAAGRPESLTAPGGATTRFGYDVQGRLASVTEPSGGVLRNVYDESPGGAGSASPVAPTIEQRFDRLGRLVHKRLPGGESETYTYDPSGNLATLVHSSGARWTFGYDASDRLVELAGPEGVRETLRWNADGRIVESVDSLGRRTLREHDAAGRLNQVRDASGATWRSEYDEAGRLSAIVDPIGRPLRLAFDGPGGPVGIEYAGARVLELRRDAGRVTEARGPAGGAVRYGYDAAGRVVSHAHANGESSQRELDAAGRPVAITDAVGNRWRAAYTAHGELAEVVTPGGARFRWLFDASNRLERVVDANDRERRIGHDALGRRSTETDGLGRTTALTYATGLAVASVALPDGTTTRITRDLLGRPVRIDYPGGLAARFRYDAAGNLLEESIGEYQALYRYDASDRLVEARHRPGDRTLRYEYDAAGRRIGLELVGVGRWTYQYDGNDALVALRDPQGRTTRFEYDAAGRVVRQQLPNGVALQRSYDARGRVQSIDARGSDGAAVIDRRYTHDAAGNPVRETREDGTAIGYRYDADGRLIAVDRPRAPERFDYDATGNRLLPGGAADYDAGDQVVRFGTERFEHDAVGRMVVRSGGDRNLRYVYNGAGRLAAVLRDGVTAAEYGYDPQGRRIWKKAGGIILHWIYDGIEPLAEFDDSGKLLQLWTLGPEIDRPVSYVDQGRVLFPIADVVGSVVAMTDEQGRVAARWDYSAFGEARVPPTGRDGDVRPDPATASPPRGFAGKRFDAEAGLYDFAARDYDPRLGRFLTTDPLGSDAATPASLHPYQYAFNSPLRYRDVTGLAPLDIADGIDHGAARAGNAIGPTIGSVLLNTFSAGVRVINATRGEAGARSNERLDTFIQKQSTPLGKAVVAAAAGLVSEPLRLGQASGELRGGRIDAGERVSAWDQAKVVGTEVLRGAGGIAPVGGALRAAAAAARSGVNAAIRGTTGALANYGRAAGGIVEGGEVLVPMRQKVGENIIDFMGESAATIQGRTFVNSAYAPQWYGQLMAHEGTHVLIGDVIAAIEQRLGTTAISSVRNTSKIATAVEETLAWTAQKFHAQAFGGPTGLAFGRDFAPLVTEAGKLIPVPNTWGEIFSNIGRSYLGTGGQDAAKTLAALAPVPALAGLAAPPVSPPATPAEPSAIPPDGSAEPSPRPLQPYDPRRDPGMGGRRGGPIALGPAAGGDFAGGVPGGGSQRGTGATGAPQGSYQAEPASSAPGAPTPAAGMPGAVPFVPGVGVGVGVGTNVGVAWCWSDTRQAYYQTPAYPCPPTRTTPSGPPPSASQGLPGTGRGAGGWPPGLLPGAAGPGRPQPGAGGTQPGQAASAGAGAGASVPGPVAGAGAPAAGNAGSGGTTTASPAGPGTGGVSGATATGNSASPSAPPAAQPRPPATAAAPPQTSSAACTLPLCTNAGQTAGQNCTPWSGDFYAQCYANMLTRCQQGTFAGRTGDWCVRLASPDLCAARAADVCKSAARQRGQ